MRDPLAHPRPLMRRVYAYAAYRLGDGPEAEDAMSETFERAIRYRSTYDERLGEPAVWLIGIARRCVSEVLAQRAESAGEPPDQAAPGNLEVEAVARVTMKDAVAQLSTRDRELIGLRYGGDLSARQIAEVLDSTTNAVEVGLHRALSRLRGVLTEHEIAPAGSKADEDPVRI